eukprot:TRINITY_DN99052_c0_g1_i1.p1 TRINITY_DN99052_c0_g1~~TRINITY_DN99052_c0_g1_i1.p1  ORF type:complete len:198 (+),score=47.78 TRINITY_DN99052_c0_g1_i1:163-756(+)
MSSQQQEYDHFVKLLLLGDSAVGKSSLLMRFCEDKFDTNFVLTIGVDFKWKIVQHNGKTVKLQVWDTAGQERFRTITPAYYRAAMGVVICYDICDKESFDHVEYWLEQLSQHGVEGVHRVLVGNKADLAETHRAVSEEEGRQIASKHGIDFFETSAKSGVGVQEAFLSIADKIISTQPVERKNTLELKQKKKGSCAC